MSKIAIYIRVSTVDQSSGLRSQKKALLEYAENKEKLKELTSAD